MGFITYIAHLTTNLPIKKKIIFIVLVTTSIALLLASSAFVVYDYQTEKQDLSQELGILTRIIAQRSAAALVFEDKALANENLQALSENKNIKSACIYTINLELFSQYIKSNDGSDHCEKEKPDINTGFIRNYYIVQETVSLDNSLVGYLFLKSSLDEINERLINYLFFIVTMVLIAGLIAFILALKLQKLITGPIADLSEATRKVYDKKDYSIRVKKTAGDEVGSLVDAYNDMLGNIEDRDIALIAAKDNLERLVKERTSKLKQTQDELIRHERMSTLGQLTATVSHELRNPLGTIRTSIFTLSNKLKNKDPVINNILERIERNIVRSDNIITELLDYSRIRALNHEETNLSSWVRSIVNEMSIPNSIKIKLEINESVDVEIDRDLFRRVIINIIENSCQAIKESIKNDSTLLIQTVLTESTTEVVISDTGNGVSEDIYPHIFEPLYSSKGFGVGLGLSIAKQIMEQHGGGITVSSEKNVGTKVILWFPSALNVSNKLAS